MAFIDFVSWNPTSNDIYAYRYPETNLSTSTQLLVYESQEAILFSKGQIIGKFGAGKHTLSTENLPVLRNLFGIPFGGKNPFTAEVWFVNKTATINSEWISETMRYADPNYNNAMVPLVAKGTYGIRVQDAERFLVRLVGSLKEFNKYNLAKHFEGELISRVNSSVSSFMISNRIGIDLISGYLTDLSSYLKRTMAEFWEQYGFAVEGFYVTSIDVNENTQVGKKIAEALANRAAQNIEGYSWQQQQIFKAMNSSAENGSSSGILAAAMLTGGITNPNNGFANTFNNMMNPVYTNVQNQSANQFGAGMNNYYQSPNTNQNIMQVFCSRCGTKYPSTSKFCPNCGNQYRPCPACGRDNPEGSTRCVVCGSFLTVEQDYSCTCPKCRTAVKLGTKWCPNCGEKL